MAAQLHRAVELQQSQVAVQGGLVVVMMDDDVNDAPPLLGLLVVPQVMFTCTERSRMKSLDGAGT